MSKKAKPTVTTEEPWKQSIPYLLGDEAKGISGILPFANQMFAQGGFSEEMQPALDMYTNHIMSRAQSPAMDFAQRGAGEVMQGAFDTRNSRIADIAGAPQVNAQKIKAQTINAPQTDLLSARSAQGNLNPGSALGRMLSGRPDNPYLDQQAAAITGQMTRNLNENIMPGIRSEALASGQYGGSRQGIAEGLAASRMNQDLAPALTNLYGGAFENAQQRMFGTAHSLNDQAFQNAQMNANRQFGANQQNVANNLNAQQFNAGNNMDAQKFNANNALNTQQFNANLGLQNNAQAMTQNSTNLANRLQGLNALNAVNGMQDSNFGRYMDALQMPQNLNWQNLGNYNQMVTGMGGGTQSQTNYKNPAAGALGGAVTGGMLGGPVGGLIGGGLGLLGGLF